MHILLALLLIIFFIFIFKTSKDNTINNMKKKTLIYRFRKEFTNKNQVGRRSHDSYLESLLKDPGNNININYLEKEEDLLEKANIHKTRLSIYGKSKMNNRFYFKDSKGGVFTLSEDGIKDYI